MNEVTIIGGGLGGLFTGALLAKEGRRVTILEKNATPGGGLQTFVRGGVRFETGMHILGGLREGGSVWKICRHLGILDRLRLRPVDSDCIDSVTYLATGDTYRLPEGREAFTDYLCQQFPAEAGGIRAYVAALYALADEVDFFYLRPERADLFHHSAQFFIAADQLISSYVGDPRLRDLLGYMNPMYGGVEGHTPAYIHALINVLYIEGPSRFVGGSQQMADALADVVRAGGGEVITQAAVTRIGVEKNPEARAVSVEWTGRDGQARTLPVETLVSAIHPTRLAALCPPGTFSRAYTARLQSLPNTYSAFTLYIVFHPQSFPYINHTCYLQDDYGFVWQHGRYDPDTWPRGFMYMTCPDPENDASPFATKMIVNCIMPYSAAARWADTLTGRRGTEYEEWKRRHADRIVSKLERVHPGIRSAIARVYTSSPLTIRDYYGQPEGALYGVRKDCQNPLLSQLAVFTKVRNLFLTGQNINLHGICGVPLTAINTAEAIVGRNTILSKINPQ